MKKRLLLVYVFVAFVLLCTNVYAVITMDLSLVADKNAVKPGDELEVTVNLKNISTPISSIEGYINVKESVLGEFSQDMLVTEDGKIEVKSGDKVNKLSYAFNPKTTDADYDIIFNTNKENIENNDCFFVMDLKNDISSNADILKLKFDIKEDATIETVKDALKVEFVKAYSDKDDENDKSEPISAALDIKIEKEEEKPSEENKTEENKVDDNKKDDNTNNNNQGQNNGNGNGNSGNGNAGTNNNNDKNDNRNNTNTNTNKNTNKNTNTNRNTNTNTNRNRVANNTNTDGTVSGNKLPAAGAGMLIIPVIIFAILAYISYNRYIKYKDI